MTGPQESGSEQLDRLPDGKIPAPARYVEYDGQVIVRERYSTHQRWKNAGSHDGKRGDPPTILGSQYCRDEDEVLKPKNDHLDVNEIEVYYVDDSESVVYEVAEEEPEIVTDGGLRTPTHCPHCGYDGAFDGHGRFTRQISHSTLEGDGHVETHESWDKIRCPDCGNKFALLNKTVRIEHDEDGNEVDKPHELVTDGGEPQESGIELSERQRERFEQVLEECDEPGVPEPTDQQVMKGLLDTWDAVDDGHYSGIEREDVSVSADGGDATIGVGGAEIRITVRTDGRERSVELDHHGEGPYWLIVGEDEDGNEAIVGEMEPVFDPAEEADRDE